MNRLLKTISTVLCWLALLATVRVDANMTITWVNLTPEKASSAAAYAVQGTNQVGYAVFGGKNHAILWSGSAQIFQDLHPAYADQSVAYALDSTNQVGYATLGNSTDGFYNQAALWSGTADSFVNLNPAGALSSTANAVKGAQQGGQAEFILWDNVQHDYYTTYHAALWSGASGSFVDLHPPGVSPYRYSTVNGLSDSQQVGGLGDSYSPPADAVLWSGTGASMTYLDPVNNYWNVNSVTAASATRQAGFALINSLGETHAVQWKGKSDPYVDLNPLRPPNNFYYSAVYATTGGQQAGVVGSYDRDPNLHAALWFGTASSFVDLHKVLGPGFVNSEAHGIWTSGYNGVWNNNITYVVGFAKESVTGTRDAILWTIARATTWPAPYLAAPVFARAGLNLFSSSDSGDPTKPVNLQLAGEAGLGWLNVSNTVTYTLTVADFPGTNYPVYQAHLFLASGLPATNGSSPEYVATNLIYLDIQGDTNGHFNAAVRYKINQPSSLDIFGPDNGMSGTLAQITSTVGTGNWGLRFLGNTNVTLFGPAGISTNFVIADSKAQQFTDPLTVCLGTQPNSTANIGQAVVLGHFSITGNASPINDNFVQDVSLNTNLWQVASGNTTTVQFVPSIPCLWLKWTLPDSGFFLEGTTDLANSNSWYSLTGPDATVAALPMFSTGNYRVALLTTTNFTSSANFFRLRQQPFTRLQVLLPGEVAAPGTLSGKSGTPDVQIVGVPFTLTVNAVDDNWNVMSLVTDTVSLSASDPAVGLSSDAALVNGTSSFTATISADGTFTITAADLDDPTKADDTSSQINITL